MCDCAGHGSFIGGTLSDGEMMRKPHSEEHCWENTAVTDRIGTCLSIFLSILNGAFVPFNRRIYRIFDTLITAIGMNCPKGLTAYALAPEYFEQIEAIVGKCKEEELKGWM